MSDEKVYRQIGNKPTKEEETIDVKNTELIAAMKEYAKNQGPDTLNALVNVIRTCRVLLPANLNEQKQPMPCLIKNQEGAVLIPIYTNKEEIPEKPKSMLVMNMPYLAINNMAMKMGQPVPAGIVINPFTDNLVFRRPLVERIDEVEKQRAAQPKEIKMTEQQYLVFERQHFVISTACKEFFREPAAFMERLVTEREEFIDRMFEETYKENRMYQFLPEDFSVMPINVTEELRVIRVDLPDRDVALNSTMRLYFAYDKERELARYFTIDIGPDKTMLLNEYLRDSSQVKHGVAPVDGVELQTVVDFMTETTGIGS